MKHKDYEPIDLVLFQSTWEKVMEVLDTATHQHTEQLKYELQCKIDVAKIRGEWE